MKRVTGPLRSAPLSQGGGAAGRNDGGQYRVAHDHGAARPCTAYMHGHAYSAGAAPGEANAGAHKRRGGAVFSRREQVRARG